MAKHFAILSTPNSSNHPFIWSARGQATLVWSWGNSKLLTNQTRYALFHSWLRRSILPDVPLPLMQWVAKKRLQHVFVSNRLTTFLRLKAIKKHCIVMFKHSLHAVLTQSQQQPVPPLKRLQRDTDVTNVVALGSQQTFLRSKHVPS